MRVVFLLGSVLFISWCGEGACHSGRPHLHHTRHHDDEDCDDSQVFSGSAAPTDDCGSPVSTTGGAPIVPPDSTPAVIVPPDSTPAVIVPPDSTPAVIVPPHSTPPVVAPPDSTPPVGVPATGYRKETTDTLSKQSSEAHSQTNTKDKVKVITKHRKDGSTVTIIKDKSKTKTKKELLTDDYNQTNHTVTEGLTDYPGVEDSTSLTTDKQHQVKEVDVVKKKDTERIVTDKYGNVISDTHKTKEKEKVRTKEKNTETSTLVHTVKSVPPPVAAGADPTNVPSAGC